MQCLFCKIIDKQINAEIIYEDEWSLAFLDVHPRTPGHALVIPKKHTANILEIDDDALEKLIIAVKKTTQNIENSLKPQGFTLGLNHGKISGQEIEHLHFHIIPRYTNDEGGSIQSVVHNLSQETINEIAKKILG